MMDSIYTKEMANNGVLPSVGMECLFKHGGYEEKGVVTAITKEYIVLTNKSGKERIRKLSESPVKPLTPPITLIDGKAYQFEYDGDTFQGIYSVQGDDFHSDKFVSSANICTNIQPLTVEVK
jgi:hypothetical protein